MNIVFYFLVLFLVIIFLYLNQRETFVSEPVDTLDSVTKSEVNLIIDSLLKISPREF